MQQAHAAMSCEWVGAAVPCIDFQLMRERAGVLEGDILEVISAMEPAARKSALDAIWDVEQQVRIFAVYTLMDTYGERAVGRARGEGPGVPPYLYVLGIS